MTLREKAKPGKLAELREIRISLSRRSLLVGSLALLRYIFKEARLTAQPYLHQWRRRTCAQEPERVLIPKNKLWTLRNISFDLHNAKVIGSFKDGLLF